MNKMPGPFLWLLFVLGTPLQGRAAGSVHWDAKTPPLEFAAQELEDALEEVGREDIQVALIVKPDDSSPEAFQIRSLGPAEIEIVGSDATGAMYGGLEVADLIRLGLPVEKQQRTPFVKKRGIKFNNPWDARTPSYDDTGDAAQKNIDTIWDFEFWQAYLDDLARYRYNVLSLWSTHPYPSIIQLEEYPEVALDDVYRVADDIVQPHYKNRLQDVDLDKPGTLQRVKKISIEEKINHWQRVFQYAEDRGIEIYLFHWNVMTFGATGIHSVEEWGKAIVTGQPLKGITPLQVADRLDEHAAPALDALPALRAEMGGNVELQETLNDIEGMAHLKDAVDESKAYAAIASSQYKTQLMARTHFMDWNRILAEVEKEVATVQREGDFPEVRFANLKEGAHLRPKPSFGCSWMQPTAMFRSTAR
ncbi:hypothetical protein [Novipirellula artificiosorum]|uniref:Beta-hexosaminidase bacterial type N-terminal domain-containing protein n=1 Tax=Novipirellula artificiosorum TaxID=2528016 RepID=A0A5C6D2Q8_9BACT|nr:hypothetical protein [Novipirellula artificiosorum]TWU31222.1 hypothetical protein Poly41_64130 [Novipirellula artificiosorum]